jgi:hemerythrin-like metal-binding protein
MFASLKAFGFSLFIVVALLIIGIGFMFGIDNPLPWIMIVVLAALPFIHRRMIARRFVTWHDGLATGIEVIDNDHRKLLTLLNNLQSAVYYPTGESFERQALNELVDYTKYHFEREERLMREASYADYEAHKRQHDEMVARVGEFLAAYERNREGTIEKLTRFLKEWLVNHIAGTDQKYVPTLRPFQGSTASGGSTV